MERSREKLMRSLLHYDNQKYDESACVKAVTRGDDGFLFRDRPVKVTGTALKQLCAINGIPATFFSEKMDMRERKSVFNRLNSEQAEVERMYRFHGDTLYGVVSLRYKKIDNIRLLDVLQAADDSGISIKPVIWKLAPDHTRVTLVPDRSSVGELTPCIILTNSENGLASLTLWAGVFRWVCSNGMMVSVGDVTKTRWFHIGNNEIVLPDISIVLNRASEATERLYAARSQYLGVEDKAEIAGRIAGALGQPAADKVAETANREYHGGRTMFDVVNAVTRAAQTFPPARQSQAEAFASHLLAA